MIYSYRIREKLRITKMGEFKRKYFFVEEYRPVLKWIMWFIPHTNMEWVPITHRDYFGDNKVTKFKTVDGAKNFIDRYIKCDGKLQTNISRDVKDENNSDLSDMRS